MMEEGQISPYQAVAQGRLLGVLQWPHFEALWTHLSAHPDGWYVWDMSGPPPEEVLPAPAFRAFLADSEAYLRARHKADYFGVIYADNLVAPAFLKIFDPKHMGSACNVSGKPIDPRWTLTRLKPDVPPAPTQRKRGLMGLFQRA